MREAEEKKLHEERVMEARRAEEAERLLLAKQKMEKKARAAHEAELA